MLHHRFSLPVLGASVMLCSSLAAAQTSTPNSNTFNPAISLILDGHYADHQDEFELPGFQLGGETGLPKKGFGLGHSELNISANIDDLFYGSVAIAIHEHDGKTETGLEEAFVETLGLDHGFSLKAGRFFSHLGYMNSQHEHAWDFADAPLVYAALFGTRLSHDGVQARWLAPTDQYLELGAEISRGDNYPGGDNNSDDNNGHNGRTLFAKTGSDLGANASWQLGASAFQTQFLARDAEEHDHAHDHEEIHGAFALEDGKVNIFGVDAVFKWAPTGNSRARQLVLQGEYFQRTETATLHFTEGSNSLLADYDGKQNGYYLQAVYRFLPAWRAGVRYDAIKADNRFSLLDATGLDLAEFLDDTGMGNTDSITRRTLMLDYAHSEFSRLRFQYAHLDMPGNRDELFMIQYSMSLGAHGAHRY